MAKLASERQAKIIEMLRLNGTVETNRLAEELQVSTMTIHRDLNKLADAGIINKVHGGATLYNPVEIPTSPDLCPMCNKVIKERTAFILHTADGKQTRACCAHCGLVLLETIPDIKSILTTDFLYGTIVSISQTTFLMHSNITVCCSPTILTFDKPEDAIRFQRGFGGTLADFETARQFIQDSMQQHLRTHAIPRAGEG
ncbi:MAG: DeoR family transcriptional regulator [Anaerolineales bacterium]|jgi:DeoR/GlpR family transcriptional regulator of sugar metabolism